MCYVLRMQLYPCQHEAWSDQFSGCEDARRHPYWIIHDALRCPRMRYVTFDVPQCSQCAPPATVHAHTHTNVQPMPVSTSATSFERRAYRGHQRALRRLDRALHRDEDQGDLVSPSDKAITSPRSLSFIPNSRRASTIEADRYTARRGQRSPIAKLLSRPPKLRTTLNNLPPSSNGDGEQQQQNNQDAPRLNRRYSASELWSLAAHDTATSSSLPLMYEEPENDNNGSLLSKRRNRRRSRLSRSGLFSFPAFEPGNTNDLLAVEDILKQGHQDTLLPRRRRSRRARGPSHNSRSDLYSFPEFEPTTVNALSTVAEALGDQPPSLLEEGRINGLWSSMAPAPTRSHPVSPNERRQYAYTLLRSSSPHAADDVSDSTSEGASGCCHQDNLAANTFALPIRTKRAIEKAPARYTEN